MVVDFLPLSNRNCAIPDFCSLISDRDEWQIANALIEPCELEFRAPVASPATRQLAVE
jgi:hypothetical protein